MAGVEVRIESLTKRFGSVVAVDQLSLDVHPGELFTLLGPSGCGKTTLLRTVAGFYIQDSGSILFQGKRMDDIPPHRRDTGMVFQSYAVFPFMSVFDNVAYGLKARKVPAAERRRRVGQALELVRLSGFERRRPDQLSGGQLQRVAVARAVVIEPRVLLMDEPLSNLDAKLRVEMRTDIRRLQRELGTTTIYVTHDQEEALAISDRIAVMSRGRVQQVGSPWEIYSQPRSTYVAGFIGVTNFVSCRLLASDPAGGTATILFQGLELQAPLSAGTAGGAREAASGQTVIASIRPESLALAPPGGRLLPQQAAFQARVVESSYLGSTLRIVARSSSGDRFQLAVHNPKPEDDVRPGSPVRVAFDRSELTLFAAGERG